MTGFSPEELAQFARDGFLIVPQLASMGLRAQMSVLAHDQLMRGVGPLEFEADTGYPNAPASRTAPGGGTIRRLLQAYSRGQAFRNWVRSPGVVQRLQGLLGPSVSMSQAHHNCVMTKNPAHSSVTGWHQDIRYWSFEQPELVSVWLALTPERLENGCLLLVPGSHRLEIRPDQYDERLFFRTDLEENRAILARQVPAELNPGDVLFFHARALHAAGRNETGQTKFAAVFTFHATANRPLAGTRSASLPDIPLS